MKKRTLSGAYFIMLLVALTVDSISTGHAQSDSFYKGKTLKVLVGTTAGSFYDIWARTVAAHLPRHIPGNPDSLVQNMPGAGHKIATNYMYSVAKPDGLTIIGSTASVAEVTGGGLGRVAGEQEFSADWDAAAGGDAGVRGDVVNTVSRMELQGYMANTLLRDTDVMSMAHSLEVRVPFVDVNVVEFVLSLPGEWKLHQAHGGGKSLLGEASVPKPLLADAVADLLPRDFLARRKMGFTLPFEKWMQGRLRTEVGAVFADEGQLTGAGLVPNGARAVWQRFLHAPRAVGWSRPWSLFVLANWCRINRVTL